MEKVAAIDFYNAWIHSVKNAKELLLKIWRSPKEYTLSIKGNETCIIKEVSKKLNLLCYPRDYYSIDAILYKKEDLVPEIRNETYWFRDIRVAFEHENNFNKSLYQEVSHLLIIHADLKVLVTYPNKDPEIELKYLHEIIKGNRQSKTISNDESFLIILGYEKDFIWEGFVYKNNGWKQIFENVII